MAKKKKIRNPVLQDGKIHAFRTNGDLTTKLESLKNKSAFITAAIVDAFTKEEWVSCPTCKGTGLIKKR